MLAYRSFLLEQQKKEEEKNFGHFFIKKKVTEKTSYQQLDINNFNLLYLHFILERQEKTAQPRIKH